MTRSENLLCSLPSELIIEVLEYLDISELGCLRQTCKKVCHTMTVTYSFDRKFFRTRHCMVEHESLEALLGIAHHPRLARVVEEVHICTYVFQDTVSWLGHQETLRFWSERLGGGYLRRADLIHLGRAQDMLIEIFSSLPNLSVVHFRDYDKTCGGQTELSLPWGWTRFPLQAFEERLVPDPEPWILLSDVLSALDRAKSRLTTFQISLWRSPELIGYWVHLPECTNILSNLQELKIDVWPPFWTSSDEDVAKWPDDAGAIFEAALRFIIQRSPSLKLLSFDYDPWLHLPRSMISWLGDYGKITGSRIPKHLYIPCPNPAALSTLELKHLSVEKEELVAVCSRFNLTELNLHGVGIVQTPDDDVHDSPWQSFLTTLARSLESGTRLCSIAFDRVGNLLGPPSTGIDWQSIVWLPSPKDRRSMRTIVVSGLEAIRFHRNSGTRYLSCQAPIPDSKGKDKITYNSTEASENVSEWLIRIADLIQLVSVEVNDPEEGVPW